MSENTETYIPPEFLHEHVIGIMIGCAVGDMMGKPVEGWDQYQLDTILPSLVDGGRITKPVKPFSMLPERDGNGKRIMNISGRLGLGIGDYTDDTILTIAIARSLVTHGMDIGACAQAHIDAYHMYPAINGMSFFGRTTTSAIERLTAGVPVLSAAEDKAPGNAPAMKMSPLGIYMCIHDAYEEGLQFAQLIGKMTHRNEESILSGVIQAHAIYMLLNDPHISKQGFLSSCIEICKHFYPSDESSLLEKGLQWILDHPENSKADAYEHALTPAFPVYHSYPFVMFMLYTYWDAPMEGILEVVNSGGDADTTASIFGSLAGARHGAFYPRDWLSVLHNTEEIIQIGEAFFSM